VATQIAIGALEALADEIGVLEPDERDQAWKRVRGRIAPLLDPSTTTGTVPAAALAVENLADVDDDALPPTLADVLVEAQVNWLSGHPAHGKTTIAMHAALTATGDGRDVLWIDWEGGRAPTKRRLLAMGATASDFELFHYVYSPRVTADAAGLRAILDVLQEMPGTLVVLDSASKALSAAGLSENSADDTTKLTTEVILPMREHATVVVIDHVTKGATRTTPYARGSGAKLADTEVMWFVEAVTPFSRSQIGEVLLTKHKDREGVLPERVRFEVGDGNGKLPVKRVADDADAARGTDSKARRAVLDLLAKHDGAKLSTKQLVEMVSGRATDVRAAAAALADDPAQPVSSEPGARGAVLYSLDASAVTALPI
jgi:NADPH-dependent ferric siderophore reductase